MGALLKHRRQAGKNKRVIKLAPCHCGITVARAVIVPKTSLESQAGNKSQKRYECRTALPLCQGMAVQVKKQ